MKKNFTLTGESGDKHAEGSVCDCVLIGPGVPCPDRNGVTRIGSADLYVEFDNAPGTEARVRISRACTRDELWDVFVHAATMLWQFNNPAELGRPKESERNRV